MDRVSSLPDEVLCHILSFLTTKEAALTSILAKRWCNLLAFVPNLAIDDSVFVHPELGKQDREEIIQSFMSFVDRVLALQGNSPVNKVSIKCLSKVETYRVDGWIHNVLERGVSDLDLLITTDLGRDSDGYSDADDNCVLSPKCFKCSTLVKLKIGYQTDIGWVAGRIFLPMLKTLVLDSLWLPSDNFDILFHALPVLEEVFLVDIFWLSDVTVSSVSLKSLTIKDNFWLCTLSFDTPSLIYFEYGGYIAQDYPVVNMKNLLDARIMFKVSDECLKRIREPNNVWLNDLFVPGYSNVWKLFHDIQNVSYLYLSPGTLEVLSLCCESMPVFNNLKLLEISSHKDRGWQAMPVLLRNCPQLETLFIAGLIHDVTDKCGDACDCISREDKGRSLTSCPVNRLMIDGFRATMKEMNMIKHFLDYFPCLKRLDIYIEENDPTQLSNSEVSKLIVEMFDLYKELSNCKVELRISDKLALDEKWTA